MGNNNSSAKAEEDVEDPLAADDKLDLRKINFLDKFDDKEANERIKKVF